MPRPRPGRSASPDATSGPRHRRTTRTPRRSRVRWPVHALRVTAALVSLAVFVGSGYAWLSYRTFDSGVTRIDAIPAHSVTHRTTGSAATTGGSATDENILLVGDDHRPAGASQALLNELSTQNDGGGTNTDTMMILHIPAGGGKATVISLPRDSWVSIPGFGQGKLNSAFSDGAGSGGDAGGAQLLITTVEDLTGLKIDHFVRISMVGFYQVAQVLGPITVCLKQATQDSYSGTDLPAGVSTLDARQALSFVRQRHGLLRGDLDREVRQQYFLSAELRKVESAGLLLDPARLQGLLTAVSSALETDPGLNLLELASQFAGLGSGSVSFSTIPVTGTPTIQDSNGNAVSIVAVDFTAMPAYIARIVGPSSAYVDATAATPGAVSVQVLNGSGSPGAATTAATALAAAGFHPLPSGEAATTTLTTVTYPPGGETAAKALAARVPGAVVAASSTVHEVTLTLGTDGVAVAGRAGPAATAPSVTASPNPSSAPSAGAPAMTFTAASCID